MQIKRSLVLTFICSSLLGTSWPGPSDYEEGHAQMLETTSHEMLRQMVVAQEYKVAESDVLEMVKSFIQRGASPRFFDRRLGTPIYNAAGAGWASVLSLLLEKNGGYEGIEIVHGQRPLHAAARAGSCECIQVLMEYDVHVNSISGGCTRTPLDMAIDCDKMDAARILKNLGDTTRYRFD